ncbi:DUF2911 domain-containing protein [Aquimarina sp. AD10]|uniref:DUF2911 domain-containing protein n=1 Tax=Aureibaculum marinum TaxID=2487930 RepID=A0A3N4NN52_9FLAO|nr:MULTISPECIES: DUF2911 domain-containing protein [Flavobacteriaceae]AXT62413.1 DUF2911 domain-containing protein [Aquimarina sp. AD10]RKM90392.1 DUF2911 domain-containing protein [Aquimarina sp. AD10]RPD97671.1 DUF2911 domain-containing protein [Aureibaculum marinum]
MKIIFTILFAGILLISCKNVNSNKEEHNHQETMEVDAEKNKKKVLSPHTSAMAMVGDAHIHVDYSSPGVRGRIIFGGLLAYDQVWQSGAHMATWIETNKNLQIKGKTLPAGKYGFFTIPSKDEWTVIFNSNWEQHGKDEYDEKDDVIRFKVKPNFSEEIKEHLEYKVSKVDDVEGKISLSWEKVSIDFNFKVEQ